MTLRKLLAEMDQTHGNDIVGRKLKLKGYVRTLVKRAWKEATKEETARLKRKAIKELPERGGARSDFVHWMFD
jgi:hypothetical protein